MANRTQPWKDALETRDRRIAELEAAYEALCAHTAQKLDSARKDVEAAKQAVIVAQSEIEIERTKRAALQAELDACQKALAEAKKRMFDAENPIEVPKA